MKYKYILFDLDGTLIDTNQLIIESFKHTYRTHLNKDIEEEEILKYFGEPLITTLHRYSPENAEELYNTYIDYNESIHDNRVSLCCNIQECLEQLQELGCKLAVVTSKRSAMAHRGLELFDIKKYFSAIVTVDDTEHHKPHPEPVLMALEKLGAEPEEAIMIGDSVFDILCAHNAGVKAIKVSWGAALEHQDEEQPDYLVNDALEIIDIVSGKDFYADSEPIETALLMTANDELQANIVESLLKVYGIPLRRKYKGNDTYGKIFMGLTVHGIDLLVPESALTEAKGIIENELPVETEFEIQKEETDEATQQLLEKYNKRRRIRAWIILIFFIPGLAGLVVALISWILYLFQVYN